MHHIQEMRWSCKKCLDLDAYEVENCERWALNCSRDANDVRLENKPGWIAAIELRSMPSRCMRELGNVLRYFRDTNCVRPVNALSSIDDMKLL